MNPSAEKTFRWETVEVACNLCGKNDAAPWGGPKDGLRLVRCRGCGLIYVNPRLSPKSLQEFYRQAYFDDGDYGANPLRFRMYRMEIDRLLPIVGAAGRFLDVGCAMGGFLKTLPGTFEKCGVEFSDDAARHAREKFGLNVKVGQLSELEHDSAFFDVVQMRGVIEHLQDPGREVKTVNRILKTGGWFVLNQTPNVGGASGFFYREGFNQVKPLEHLYYFSTRTIRRLLEERGFEIRGFWFPYWGTPYAAPWKDFPNFILNRLRGAESPAFPGNMMAVYAQKAKTI